MQKIFSSVKSLFTLFHRLYQKEYVRGMSLESGNGRMLLFDMDNYKMIESLSVSLRTGKDSFRV